MINPAQSAVAARLLNRTAEGFEISRVSFNPSAPTPKGKPAKYAAIDIEWTVGPAWGTVRLEFLPMHYVRPGDIAGVWRRAEGVAMMPAGFPMLPALKDELAGLAAEAIAAAEINLPAGIPFETAA